MSPSGTTLGGDQYGFTLMEVLVTLVLVSLATMLMFQTLGSYRIAKERVSAQSGVIDRGALFDAWFRESIQSLHANKRVVFEGDEQSLAGMTLASSFGMAGAGIAMRWSLAEGRPGDWRIRYAEDDKQRWELSLAATRRARFGYLDDTGKLHDAWPPALGLQEQLPAAVVLRRTATDGVERVVVAAVRGPRKPYYSVFEMERD